MKNTPRVFSAGNADMLPYLYPDIKDESKKYTEIKSNRCRWAATPKEDKRESVRDYIQNTREILLAKIAMTDKKAEAGRMQEYIKQKESVLNLNKEIYEQDKDMVSKYVEFMKSKAYNKKREVDEKAKARQDQEATLERLIQFRTNLKRNLNENKEICASYKADTDFMKSLNSDITKTKEEPKVRKSKQAFITEQNNPKEKEVESKLDITDKELRELKEEYDLSENDSDKEILPEFSSPEEMLELMNKQAMVNLTLIQDVQKREESLERMKKESRIKIETKEKILETIRNDIKELGEEERRKLARLTELAERTESDAMNSLATKYASENHMEQSGMELKRKKEIAALIASIKNIFTLKDKFGQRAKTAGTVSESTEDVVYNLTFITDCFIKLKMIRNWKFMTIPASTLISDELKTKDAMKLLAAEDARIKNMELMRKKRSDLIKNWNLPRFTKTGKETMRKKVMKDKITKKKIKKEEKIEDEFDDKYFID